MRESGAHVRVEIETHDGPPLPLGYALPASVAVAAPSRLARELYAVLPNMKSASAPEECWRSHVRRACDEGLPVTLITIDLDRLARINETRGRLTGDLALAIVRLSLSLACRRADLWFRSGDDEFAIVAPGTTAGEAVILAQRIQATVSRLAAERQVGKISVSIGIADFERARGAEPDDLLAAASEALAWARTAARRAGGVAVAPRRRPQDAITQTPTRRDARKVIERLLEGAEARRFMRQVG